jgi:hypothetical protein
MQHVASYGLSNGREPNNISLASFYKDMTDDFDKMQAKRIGLDFSEFKNKTISDWWLFGNRSVENKVADKLGKIQCSEALLKKKDTKTFSLIFAQIEVTTSACPLIEAPLEIKVTVGGEKAKDKDLDKDTKREIANFLESLNSRVVVERMLGKKE